MAYFLLKISYYGVIQFVGNPALSVRYAAGMQVVEFLLLVSVLFIFRPRALPSFYSLGLNEINVRKNTIIYLKESMGRRCE